MEEINLELKAQNTENSPASRLNKIAEEFGLTADQLLDKFEESQAKNIENDTSDNRSIGSQGQSVSDSFDPAGSEFLKGIWGR